METEKIKKLALDLKFEVSDEEALDIQNDFVLLEKMLDVFDTINTDGVEEMIYPFEEDTYYLREDVPDHVIDQEDVLKNAPKQKAGHIVVPKVVK